MSIRSKLRQVGFVFLTLWLALGALLLITSASLATPATLASTRIVNPGDSIQAAIDVANPGDTIVINPGTYNESLTLNKAVNLTGVNSATVIINALPNQRVLMISGGTINNSVVVSGFTVANGNVTGDNTCPTYCGGGVLITGTAQPQMWNLIFINNRASSSGGGLYASGPLTLNQVSFISNSVQAMGGGESRQSGGGAVIKGPAVIKDSYFERNLCSTRSGGYVCDGGGLSSDNTLIVDHSQFISNTIDDSNGSGGGLSAGHYGVQSAIIRNSLFQNNRCLGWYCHSGGLDSLEPLQIIDTTFINNQATLSGGGVGADYESVLTRVRFEGNQTSNSMGGGLCAWSPITVVDSIFVSNSAGYWGGGMFAMTATVVGGRFENNSSPTGGGLRAGQVIVTGTSFLNNVAQSSGGGLVVQSGRIANAVFAGNRDSGYAAAVLASGNALEILHTTITSPTLATGPAIRADSGTVGITDTIITSHTLGIQQNASSVVYEDYNLFFGNTSNFSGTVGGGAHAVFSDPNFANPTIDNYHIISPSAAIDVGINAGVTTDFDGILRPIGAGYDIGAYEYVNWTSHVYLPLILR